MGGTCSKHGRDAKWILSFSRKTKRRDHLGGLGVGGMIIIY